MRLEFERRSLELTPSQWASLIEIAAQTASLAPSGPTAGQASWRTLIKRIADYEMEVRMEPRNLTDNAWVERVDQLRQMVSDLADAPATEEDVQYYLTSPDFFGTSDFNEDDARFLEQEMIRQYGEPPGPE